MSENQNGPLSWAVRMEIFVQRRGMFTKQKI